MSGFAQFRWRLARLIAPTPIIAEPLGDGSAILLRDNGHPRGFGWITPAKLDIQSEITVTFDEYAIGNFASYTPNKRIGTITGEF